MTPITIPRWFLQIISTRSACDYPSSWYPRDTCQLVTWTIKAIFFCFITLVLGVFYGAACFTIIQGISFSSMFTQILAHIAATLLVPAILLILAAVAWLDDTIRRMRRDAAYKKRELEGWAPVQAPEPSKWSLIYQSLRGKLCIPIQVKSNASSTQGSDED
jgi:hypothetical protein